MNLVLPSGFDFAIPDELMWVALFIAFFGAGSALICAAGLACLAKEVMASLKTGSDRSPTAAAEFMGFGVAKERTRGAVSGQPRPAIEQVVVARRALHPVHQ